MNQRGFSKVAILLAIIAILGAGGAVAYFATNGFGRNNDKAATEFATSTPMAESGQPNDDSIEGLLQPIIDGTSQRIVHCSYDITSEQPDMQHVELYLKNSSTLIGHQGGDKANMLVKDTKAYVWGSSLDMDGMQGIIVNFSPDTGLARDIDKSTNTAGFVSPQALLDTAKGNNSNRDVANAKCSAASGVDDSVFTYPDGIIFQDMSSFSAPR